LERCKKLGELEGVEVILVDNGSTDETYNVLKDILPSYRGCRSIKVSENQGYGFGILSGLRVAKGDIIGWTHADMQTDPIDCIEGLKFFDEHGTDIFVKGKRYGRPLADVFFTMGMSIFETVLLGRKMSDINAQPTLFSKSFFLQWDNPPHDFSLDLYAYFMASVKELKIYRFPVKFGERAHGVSHWNVDWRAKRKFIERTINFSLDLKKRLK
jgi:glycosyltransferase involved in cell wall biosynthesis